MIKHYSGMLGDFDYDDSLWKVTLNNPKDMFNHDTIMYIGDSSDIYFPDGLCFLDDVVHDRTFEEIVKLHYHPKEDLELSIEYVFSRCIFKKGFDLSDSIFLNASKIFNLCVFNDNLIFGRNFYMGEECFFGCVFNSGCNLYNLKYIREDVCNALPYCILNEDFYLPDIDNIEKIFRPDGDCYFQLPESVPRYAISKSDFDYLKDYLCDSVYEVHEEQREKIDEKLKNIIKAMLSWEEIVLVADEAVHKLLLQGKSKEDIFVECTDDSEMKYSLVNIMYKKYEKDIKAKCCSVITDLFGIDGETLSSKYTVGQIQDLLVNKGFPEDVVNECLIKYLKNEYLVQ